MDYSDVIDPVMRELHEARHTVISFGEQDENPLLDWGTAVGFLLGLHYACSYQRSALKLNRALFQIDRVDTTRAVDLLSEAIAEKVFGVQVDPDWKRLERLRALADVNEGEATTDTPFWPLPERPPKPWEDTGMV